jgi:hypothetical protein
VKEEESTEEKSQPETFPDVSNQTRIEEDDLVIPTPVSDFKGC